MPRIAKSLSRVAAVIGAFALSWAVAPAASADDAPATAQQAYNVVQLGDSYSAGNGAGDYYGDPDAYLSHRSYGSLYYDWLATQPNLPVNYVSYAHSGAETTDVLSTQVPNVAADTDLVMFTIGGNDVHFQDIVKTCLVVGERSESSCRDSLGAASAGFPDVIANTREIFTQLAQTIGPDAQIVLVGYPYLVQDVSYHLCDWVIMCWGDHELDVSGGIRALTDQANSLQSALVDSWNTQSGVPQATFVPVSDLFDGHEPSPGVTNPSNDYRWMQQFLETETTQVGTSETTSTFSTTKLFFYHPGVTGHQQIAQRLESVIGVPSNAAGLQTANAALPTSGSPVDADPTASMVDDWVRPVGSTVTLDARGSVAGAGSIVSYEWDFDGDGTYDLTTTEPWADHEYAALFDGQAVVRVTQTGGQTDTASARVRITDDGDSTPSGIDNCPDVYNYSQSDLDGDGIGDECDPTPGWPSADRPGVLETTDGTAVSMSASSVAPGQALQVTATGFVPGDAVEVWMHSDPVLLASGAVVGADGTVLLSVTVPADAEPGAHTLVVRGVATYDTAAFTVVRAAAARLAESGPAPSGWVAPAGLAVLAAGLVTVLAVRRRRA
jgi:lysophospholipase L1-like esterase